MEWLHFYCTRWCTFHIRKVLELPNSPQDPIIIDLGKKRGGNIIINYFWRALLTPLVPGNVQKKLLIAAYPSRISTCTCGQSKLRVHQIENSLRCSLFNFFLRSFITILSLNMQFTTEDIAFTTTCARWHRSFKIDFT